MKKKILIAAFILFVLALIAGGMLLLKQQNGGGISQQPGASSNLPNGVVEVDGVRYQKRADVTALLFLGVDREAREETALMGQNGFCDAVFLLVLDGKAKTMQLLGISRNTLVQLDICDADGRVISTGEGQLAYQFSYGVNDKRACQLVKNRVEDLLGVRVSGTLSLRIEGALKILDELGGIDYCLAEDYTQIDPAYTAGTVVHLQGKAAEKFLRYRDTNSFASNDDRMRRHLALFTQTEEQLRQLGKDNISRILAAAGSDLTDNLSADLWNRVTEYRLEENVRLLPGETEERGGLEVFLPEEKALQTMVLDLFYQKVN